HNGQAVGMAAALCCERDLRPRDLGRPAYMQGLQRRPLRAGQWIPHVKRTDPADLAQPATVTASTTLQRLSLAPASQRRLNASHALLLPMAVGQVPELTLYARHRQATELIAELCICSHRASYTPDVVLDRMVVPLPCSQRSPAAKASRR